MSAPSPLSFDDDEKAILRFLVDELPEEDREIVTALFYEGVSMAVVGQRLGLDKSTVMRMRDRALERLGQVMLALHETKEVP